MAYMFEVLVERRLGLSILPTKVYLVAKKKKEKQDIVRWFSVLCSLGLKSPKYEGMIKLFCFHERLFFLHHKTEQSNDSSLQVLMADKVVSNCFQL